MYFLFRCYRPPLSTSGALVAIFRVNYRVGAYIDLTASLPASASGHLLASERSLYGVAARICCSSAASRWLSALMLAFCLLERVDRGAAGTGRVAVVGADLQTGRAIGRGRRGIFENRLRMGSIGVWARLQR